MSVNRLTYNVPTPCARCRLRNENLSTKIQIKAKLNYEFKDDYGNCARLLL